MLLILRICVLFAHKFAVKIHENPVVGMEQSKSELQIKTQ